MNYEVIFACCDAQVTFTIPRHEFNFETIRKMLQALLDYSQLTFSKESVQLEKEVQFALSVLKSEHVVREEDNKILIFKDSQNIDWGQKFDEALRINSFGRTAQNNCV